MEISKKLIDELKKKDGNKVEINFKQKICSKTRVTTLIDAIKETKVPGLLCVGCGTYPQKIKDHVKNNRFLFQVFTENFSNIMGIDNNEETINIMKELGYKNIFYADLVSPKSKAMASTFFEESPFVVLLPDRLEHTENPINFLKQIIKNYGNKKNKLVLSVPNAYGYQRLQRLSKYGVELINDDHKYMFTPWTILKTLVMAGLVPERIEFAGYFDLNGNDVSSKLKESDWALGQTIVVTCSFK